MGKNQSINYNKGKNQILEQYKIELTTKLNSVLISIINSKNNKKYESEFSLEYFNNIKSFKNAKEIKKFINNSITKNNIQIKDNQSNLELIIFQNNYPNINLKINKIYQKIECKLVKSIITDVCINYASLFPSGNIVAAMSDSIIRIYDINFNIIQNIVKAHGDIIYYVNVKDENNFVTSSGDNTIKTWIKKDNFFILNHKIINAHKLTNNIFQVIYYLKGNLISYSNNEINIWEQINNKYQSISTLKHTNFIQSILLLEDKKQLISTGNCETFIWNLINFELIKILDIYCYSEKGLCRIDDDRIIIIYEKYLNVFSLSKQKIIKVIILKTHGWEIKVFNEKDIFFVRGWSHDLYIFNCDTYECIQTIKDAHQSNIGVLLKLKENIICTSSRDYIIQIWSF